MLSRADLHDYQQTIVDYIQTTPRCAVFALMGTGKTVSTLTALDELSLVENDVWPALVLAPLRVARSVWPTESQGWSHLAHLKVVAVTGTPEERARALRQKAHVYAMNYDVLQWAVDFYGDDWPFRTVVSDELTRLKSYRRRQGGKRTAALGRVAHSKIKRFIGLTGTPTPNGLKDLWGQMWFLDEGKRLGRTYHDFDSRWFRRGWDGFSVEPLPHAQREIEERLRDICLTVEGLPVDEPIFNDIEVELPPAARKLYTQMEKEMFLEIESVGVEAFNAAARTSKCLAEGTEVLTDKGWKTIESWVEGDRVWDGVEWVRCDSLVCNGVKTVVGIWGVDMTPDHLVMTTSGWKQAAEVLSAESAEGHGRQKVRLPDNHRKGRIAPFVQDQQIGSRVVAGRVRLWKALSRKRIVPESQKPRDAEVLRLSSGRNAPSSVGLARDDSPSCVEQLDWHALSMRKPQRQELVELRWSRDSSLRSLAHFFSRVLGRHGSQLSRRIDGRSNRRKRALRAWKLPVGHCTDAGQQYPLQCKGRNSSRRIDTGRRGPGVWPDLSDHMATLQERLAGRASAQSASREAKVYDLVNAGPRHRFTVRGHSGEVFLAHNCLQLCAGAIISDSDSGKWHEVHTAKLDALESVIEEAAGAPVLVAYHFKADLARLRKRFPKAVVLGSDPKIIDRWNAGQIPILLAHPMSAGHGLNLARGGNILAFFSLDWNLESYQQIIERLGPMRQKQAGLNRPVFVHRIVAKNTIDEAVRDRLESKRSVQDVLLAALRRRK